MANVRPQYKGALMVEPITMCWTRSLEVKLGRRPADIDESSNLESMQRGVVCYVTVHGGCILVASSAASGFQSAYCWQEGGRSRKLRTLSDLCSSRSGQVAVIAYVLLCI